MAFIPVFHVASALDAHRAKDGTTAQLTAISASQNNYDLGLATVVGPNNATSRVFELFATTAVNITGIVAPTSNDGKPYFLRVKDGSATITLVNASASSASANRFNATSGANVALAANGYAVLLYDSGVSQWTIGLSVPQNAFKLEVPGASEGAIVLFDGAFWSVHNTGYYDAAGTKTANAVDVFYRYGSTVPTATYASSTAAEIASQPIESGRDEVIQATRTNPCVYFLCSNATSVTCRFRKNEQGAGLNRQQ
jgi:hypothetical protein